MDRSIQTQKRGELFFQEPHQVQLQVFLDGESEVEVPKIEFLVRNLEEEEKGLDGYMSRGASGRREKSGRVERCR